MARRPQKVVFACTHNAGRSQMAAAIFNQIADPAIVSAVSAGTDPGPRVHAGVVTAMRELGIDLSRERPRLLTDEVTRYATLLVTMGCGDECPVVPGTQRDDWPLEDPKDLPVELVRPIRDDILARVRKLVEANGWARPATLR